MLAAEKAVYGEGVASAARLVEGLAPVYRARFASLERRNLPLQVPPRYAHLWHWYGLVAEGRGAGFDGPPGLTHQDFHYWRENSGMCISPMEIRIIMAIDRAWRGEFFRLRDIKRSLK